MANELAYALSVHRSSGDGEFADYSIEDADAFADEALARYDALTG